MRLSLPSPQLHLFFLLELLHVNYSSFLIDRGDTDVNTAQELPPAPPPTLDEIDVTRHREITSKAVSAILLLILKWFKVSRKHWLPVATFGMLTSCATRQDVMKFHHLGQLLLDTNCLLLILKMFGLQEVSASVVSKADSPENKYGRVFVIYVAF
jgi:hypothetical protein